MTTKKTSTRSSEQRTRVIPNNNAKFLAVIDVASKNEILASIAKHYGISSQEAFDEVTDAEAEHLLDYMVEPMRSAASVLMQSHGLRGY